MKVKLQSQKINAKSGKMPYNGLVDCLKKSIRKEGFVKLWVGFPMYYLRIAPHVMSHLIILDWFNRKDA